MGQAPIVLVFIDEFIPNSLITLCSSFNTDVVNVSTTLAIINIIIYLFNNIKNVNIMLN